MTITPAPSTELLQDVDLSSPEGCDHAMQLMTRTTFEVYCRIAHAYIYKYKHGTKEEFCERYGKSKRTLQKYEKRMRELKLIASEPPRGIHAIRAEKGASVENAQTIDVKVIEEKKEDKEAMTQEEALAFDGLLDLCSEQEKEINRLTASTKLVITSNVQQPESEPQQSGDRLNLQSEWGNTDAEHWNHIQNCDEPDSYKKAQEQLTHFKRLLYAGSKEGWSQQAFAALRDDLEQYARTCAACSGNSRERANAEIEARRASLPSAVQRSES